MYVGGLAGHFPIGVADRLLATLAIDSVAESGFGSGHDRFVGDGKFGGAEAIMLHEMLHALGGVSLDAPHWTPGLHVTDDPLDLMSAAQTIEDPSQLRIDAGRDDYWAHGRGDLVDLSRSPWLNPAPESPDALAPGPAPAGPGDGAITVPPAWGPAPAEDPLVTAIAVAFAAERKSADLPDPAVDPVVAIAAARVAKDPGSVEAVLAEAGIATLGASLEDRLGVRVEVGLTAGADATAKSVLATWRAAPGGAAILDQDNQTFRFGIAVDRTGPAPRAVIVVARVPLRVPTLRIGRDPGRGLVLSGRAVRGSDRSEPALGWIVAGLLVDSGQVTRFSADEAADFTIAVPAGLPRRIELTLVDGSDHTIGLDGLLIDPAQAPERALTPRSVPATRKYQ